MKVAVNGTVYSSEEVVITIELSEGEKETLKENPKHNILNSYPNGTDSKTIMDNEKMIKVSNDSLKDEVKRLKKLNKELRLVQPPSSKMDNK
jgi:hypothetical protein